jgi:hypothetical protein
MKSELTKAERVWLIEKALEWCGQEVTKEAIAKQYYYETQETLENEDGR